MSRILHIVACFFLTTFLLQAAERTNRIVTISALPKVEQRGEWICLFVGDDSHSYRFWVLPPHDRLARLRLETNAVYTFVVVEEPFADSYVPELVKIEQQGRTIYDIGVCEVHHVKMESKKVPVIYGLVRPAADEPSLDVEHELFPHHREIALGGCIPGEAKTTQKLVCSQCKAAYKEWKRGSRVPTK